MYSLLVIFQVVGSRLSVVEASELVDDNMLLIAALGVACAMLLLLASFRSAPAPSVYVKNPKLDLN